MQRVPEQPVGTSMPRVDGVAKVTGRALYLDDLDAAGAGAAHVIDSTYETSPQEQMYIEPQAMMAEWQGAQCQLVGSMQCPYYVHKAMKALLGCGPDGVVVRQSVTGGGFGGKEEYPSML